MSAVQDRSLPSRTPTADAPGTTEVAYDGHSLSRVAIWREEGDYVIRSLEFDVIAADPDPAAAAHKFVLRTVDYARLLGDGPNPTPEDLALSRMIFERLAEIAAAIPQERPMRRSGGLVGRLRRRRGDHDTHGWSLRLAALS